MKKITLILFLLIYSLGFAQVPSSAAPVPPARNAVNVISIYGTAYAKITGVNTNPGWGQSTVVTEVDIAGDNALRYSNFNYQGTDWSGNTQNISAMEFLHVDIWTNNQKPNVFVISTGTEKANPIATVAGSWQSLDIPVAGITGDLTKAIQFKFDGGTGGTIYIDNLYFWKNPAAAGTPNIGPLTVPSKFTGDAAFDLVDPTSDSPGAFSFTSSNTAVATISGRTVTVVGAGSTTITATQAPSGSYLAGSVTASLVVKGKPLVAAPTPPSRNTSDVISLFSDKYTNIAIDTWSAPWDDSDVEDLQIEGDNTKRITFTNFLGVDFSSAGRHINATPMTHFHIDIWTSTATLDKSFNLKLSQWNGGTAEASFIEFSTTNASNPKLPNPNPGTWISLDIPLSSWNGSSNLRNDIAQFIISSNLGVVYVDNVYMYRAASTGAPVIGALNVPAKTVGDAAFNLVDPTSDSPGAFSFTSGNTAVATISGRTVTIVGAGTSVITATQAASGSYSSGSVTADLVVSAASGGSGPTVAAPTPPARNAVDVISVYSGSYANITGVNTNPNWGQSTVVTEVSIAANPTLKYANFNYQGTDWSGNTQNISAMEFLHVDIWTNNQKPNVFVISTGAEKANPIATVAGSWQSLDIPVAGITGDLTKAIQFKFDGGTGGTIYIDNLYFWKNPAAAGTPNIGPLTVPSKFTGDAAFDLVDPTSDSPGAFSFTSSNTAVATISGRTVTVVGAGSTTITATQAPSGSYLAGSVTASLVVKGKPLVAAPTPPSRNTSDVISLFSDKYTNIAIDTWSAPWDDSDVEDLQIEGDNTKRITFTNFLGVDFSSAGRHINATPMTHFHIDIWTSTATLDKSFNLKLSQWNGGTAEASFIEFSTTNASNPKLPNPNPGTWISLDIPLSSWNGSSNLRNDIAQFIISSNLGVVYVDNVYMYRAASTGAPVIGALNVPAKTVGDAAFNLVDPTSDSPGAFSFTSGNTAVATISGRTVTIVGAGTSVITATQAASGSYSSGSVTADLVVSAASGGSGPTVAAPTPPARNAADVISIYGGTYTNITGVNTNPGWGQSTVVTEVSIAGNATLKYANFNYQGTDWAGNTQNISAMEFLHVDIWTNNQKPNVFVISAGAEKANPIATVTGSWQSLDIPVAGITGDLTKVIQFKFDGGTGGTIYIDNMYFYKGASLSTTKFETSNVKMYPNPIKNSLTIEANSSIEKVSVFSVLGQEVLTTSPKANSTTLQTSNLQKGVYIVKTVIDGKVSSSKVIKE